MKIYAVIAQHIYEDYGPSPHIYYSSLDKAQQKVDEINNEEKRESEEGFPLYEFEKGASVQEIDVIESNENSNL